MIASHYFAMKDFGTGDGRKVMRSFHLGPRRITSQLLNGEVSSKVQRLDQSDVRCHLEGLLCTTWSVTRIFAIGRTAVHEESLQQT